MGITTSRQHITERDGADVPVAHIWALRRVVFFVWLTVVALTPYPRYASWSIEQLNPFGWGHWWLYDSSLLRFVWTPTGLAMLKWCGVWSCMLAVYKPCPLFVVPAAGFIVVLDSITKALGGYANHTHTIPLLLVVALMVTSCSRLDVKPATTALASGRANWLVVRFCALVLVLPYMFVGIARAMSLLSSPNPTTALLQYLGANTAGFVAIDWWVQLPSFAPLMNLAFAGITVFEILSPVVFVSTRFRLAWLGVMTVFHLSSLLLMNVFFAENLLLMWVILGWIDKPSRMKRAPGRSPARVAYGDPTCENTAGP